MANERVKALSQFLEELSFHSLRNAIQWAKENL